MPVRICLLTVLCALCPAGFGQTGDDLAPHAIDACGVLVRGTDCVLFEGAGGRFYLADYGNYRVGDAVRVIGTADPTCITICRDADGCIRGATLYNPAVYPCGTAIPSISDLDNALVDSVCTAASGALGTLALAGMFLSRPRGRSVGR